MGEWFPRPVDAFPKRGQTANLARLVPSKFLRYVDQIDTFIRDNSRNDDKRDYPEESIKRDCPQKSTNCGPQHAAPSELVTISGSCLEIIIERGPDGLDLLNVYDTLANFLQGVSRAFEYLIFTEIDVLKLRTCSTTADLNESKLPTEAATKRAGNKQQNWQEQGPRVLASGQ